MPFRTGGAPGIGALAAFALVAFAATGARADQFTITDVTWTHSADTTSDSHYRVDPLPATPKDWTKPFDWSKGSVHVRLDVLTKPAGGTPTVMQVCFEGKPSYACTYPSPTYTTTTKADEPLQWSTPIKNHWSPTDPGGAGPMVWSNGVTKVALILKDTMNNKPQGDPKYVPTKLHMEVVVVSEGDTYKPPASSTDAGVDAAIKDASVQDAAPAAADDSGLAATPDAATVARRDASTPSGGVDSGSQSNRADAATSPSTSKSDSGCALGESGWQHSWLALLALALLRRRATGSLA